MVLQELGQKIRDALNKLNKSDEIDKKLLNEMLNSIAVALLKSDVNIHMVKSLQEKIRNQFDEMDEDVGNKKLQISSAISFSATHSSRLIFRSGFTRIINIKKETI